MNLWHMKIYHRLKWLIESTIGYNEYNNKLADRLLKLVIKVVEEKVKDE